jgi:hypothetical protein
MSARWRQVVVRVDARLDEGGTLAGTELEELLRRWPGGYVDERELPGAWLQLHPGTGARHPALAYIELAPIASAAEIERTLDSLGPSSSTHAHGWAAACLALARSDAALVVSRLVARLVDECVALRDQPAYAVDERRAQRLCLLAAHLCDADGSRDLVPVLFELLTVSYASATSYSASLAMIEIGKSRVEARSLIESFLADEDWRGQMCEVAACVGLALTAEQRKRCSAREFDATSDVVVDEQLRFAEQLLAERAALVGLREPTRRKRLVELAAGIFELRPDYRDLTESDLTESWRVEALRFVDGASGFGLTRIRTALADPSARVRTRALLRLREFGSRGSVAVDEVLERVRASPLWWERVAALRCLPAIVDDDRRAFVGETLVEAAGRAPTAYEHDELAVTGDMILSGWRP